MASPIITSEVTTFQQLGIDPKYTTSACITQGTDLIVQDKIESTVSIINLFQDNSITHRKVKASLALMNPFWNIMAIYDIYTLYLLYIDSNTSMTLPIPEGQSINYMTWINVDILAFVLGKQVFHWSVSSKGKPTAIFELGIIGTIISYSMSDDQNWMIVVSITNDQKHHIQLYSKEQNKFQIIENHYTPSFAQIQNSPVVILTVQTDSYLRVQMIPLHKDQLRSRSIDLLYVEGDMPVHLTFSAKYSTAFILTKMGFLYLVEIETPFLYYSTRIRPFIHAAPIGDGCGVMTLTSDGCISKFVINEDTIISYIANNHSKQLAMKIATAAGICITNRFLNTQFEQLIEAHHFDEAARFAIQSPSLRCMQNIQKISNMPPLPQSAPFILVYFKFLLENSTLNQFESNEICHIVLQQNRPELIEEWIKKGKLTLTEELGDFIYPYDTRIAAAIYLRVQAHIKVLVYFAESDFFDKFDLYSQRFNIAIDWRQILETSLSYPRQDTSGTDCLLRHIANNSQTLYNPLHVVQMLLQFKFYSSALCFLLQVIQDREEDGELETMVFEIALSIGQIQLVGELFKRGLYTFYNRGRVIALIQEKCGHVSNNFTF